MARICETVTASTTTELRRARDRSSADLVELRLDGVRDVDVAAALEGRTKPVIVTCRPAWEGGAFAGSEPERLKILGEAIRLGAEYVDVEWRANRAALPGFGRTRLIVSTHDFDSVPDDLAARVRAMRAAAGVGLIKVAVTTPALRDCVTLRDAVGRDGDQIVIGMGAAGAITRVCPWLYGSLWTYAGNAAPGQMPVVDLAERYRVRDTGPATAIYALVGAPLVHSASPAMHNAAFVTAGINAVYLPMETRDANQFLAVADAFGIVGASVTAPLKTAWAALGVQVDEGAQRIGAVNTLKREGGGWLGRNFDMEGFLAPLGRRGHGLRGVRAVVLGSGGAARAVAWVLKRAEARVEIVARRHEAARTLASDLGVESSAWPPGADWELLVNATPVGTWPDVDKVPVHVGRADNRVVYDLVYNPVETTLLRAARAAGADTIGGLEMLVDQAHAQFEFWTGQPAPAGVMAQAAEEFLRRWSA